MQFSGGRPPPPQRLAPTFVSLLSALFLPRLRGFLASLKVCSVCHKYPGISTGTFFVVSNRHKYSIGAGQMEYQVTASVSLQDFRNYAYVLPTVHGMHIHMEEQQTSVLVPRNRFNQVRWRRFAVSQEKFR